MTPGPRSDELIAILRRIEERLEGIEARQKALEAELQSLLIQAKAGAATAIDSMDAWARNLQERGIDIDARAKALADLLEKITEPSVLKSLEELISVATSLKGLGGVVVDALDDIARRLGERGIDLDQRQRILLHCLERLTSPEALHVLELVLDKIEVLRLLVEGGTLDPEAVRTIGKLGFALARASQKEIAGIGPMGLIFALGRPELRQSLGFLVQVGAELGAILKEEAASTSSHLRPALNAGSAS
ncbi:MAG: hypothetical protein N2515_06170 [Deltaproteobacteria bacterium]|nr:hypothetical protein [Deltaproteobacteria bacterium]MDW8246494.1 hypothetical protein [Sandaracinaceae bacterium]